MGLRFQVTVEVEVELAEPLTVQELARLQERLGPDAVEALTDGATEITPVQVRDVIWAKLTSQFPDLGLEAFDSIEGFEGVAAVG